MGVGRIALFGLAAVGALALGIGAAEVQQRFFNPAPEPSISERAAAAQSQTGAAPTAKQSDFLETAKEMFARLTVDRTEMVRSIRADCAFLHPDSSGVAGACSRDRIAKYEQIRKLYSQDRSNESLTAIAYCMDENRSLNGFDWTSVTWCYERNVVALRRKS